VTLTYPIFDTPCRISPNLIELPPWRTEMAEATVELVDDTAAGDIEDSLVEDVLVEEVSIDGMCGVY
jgi:mycofactocin precursor